MTTFIPQPPVQQDVVISNLPFYPDVSSLSFQQAMRVDFVVEQSHIEQALKQSILFINHRLADWQSEQIAAGYNTLDIIPSEYPESDKIQLYLEAVYQYAKFLLLNQYRDYDATLSGHEKADRLEQRIAYSRNSADKAISLLTGQKLTRVVLI